ncbi:MAG: hypothetical protein EOP42_22745 [Sphingobacteriaceae bacterium]|nr:MAG: hypothetical protein EOP42_22745 [Sphingobacteriaceae bacterium]
MNFKEIIYVGILFGLGIFLTIITRVYSNAILKYKYTNTNQGDPIIFLPWSNSIYSVIGLLSISISTVWAFFLNNWIGVFLVILYLFTNLIPSKLNDLRKLYRLGNHKKCKTCSKFWNYDYYSIETHNSDGTNDNCVACSSPDIWNTVQEIKRKFN